MTPGETPIFCAAGLEKDLPTRYVGRTCIVYDRVESTNDVLRAVAADPRYDGLAVFADCQTRGRGRSGRSWLAPPGSSVLVSILLVFDGSVADWAGPVNLAVTLAAVRAVRGAFGVPAVIRWPNDIYVGARKLGGILIESSSLARNGSAGPDRHDVPGVLVGPDVPVGSVSRDRAAFVVGIGLNVTQQLADFPPDLAGTACSLATALARPVDQADRLAVARQLLVELDQARDALLAREFDRLRTDWLALAAHRDRPVRVEHQGRLLTGRIVDLEFRDHSLLIQDPAGLIWHLQPNTSRLVK